MLHHLFYLLLASTTVSLSPIVQLRFIDESIAEKKSFAESSSVQSLWFDQPIDHEDSNIGRYKQRYYVNTQYFQPGGPAILFVGGEGALASGWLSSGLAVEIAKEHNGILYGLEHRYYGESQPFPTLTLEHLKYLSSVNGVKDAGNFMKNVINPITNTTLENVRWITVGGSYPGSLSAWIHSTYPDLVYAALASSAPVFAKENFFEYDQVVNKALGEQCFKNVEQVKDYIDKKYKEYGGIAKIKKTFGCSDVEDNMLFIGTIYDMLAGIVQYNSPTANPNITSFCGGFSNESSVEDKLKYYASQFKHILNSQSKTCYEYTGITELKSLNTTGAIRQWIYQCCTEFGYWQTAPNGPSTRSKYLTVDWSNEFYCSADIYGKKIGPPDTEFINTHFKGKDDHTPQTIWVNGEFDPWHKLSIADTSESTPDRPIYSIKGGSHCNDLGSNRPTDSESLTQTRKNILADFSRWLKK